MKTIERRHTHSGMALVAVLVLLVLFATLALAVFYASRVERRSSSLFAGTIEARALAETGVNLCVAQIADATSTTNRAWISQPGLIRTFVGNRTADVNYRLYSWADMRPHGTFDPHAAANAVPGNWATSKALYVDLNEPAPDPDDPTDRNKDKYPILYPPGMLGGNVSGFGVTANNTAGANATALPMPVQWLYVLRDGSVETATANGSSSVIVGNATSANPIVGRVAFWADDETTKININTAAGGRFWTPPWFQTSAENAPQGPVYGFGFSQPVKNEFQRYPGHPARTDLRAVFPEMASTSPNDPWSEFYKLTPRVIEGGSRNARLQLSSSVVSPVADTDRLYASLGELRFSARKLSQTDNRTTQAAGFANANPLKNDATWSELVERRKGFLTATSRSPELTLFGTPRVAIWPVPENPAWRSALDKLIAFCSTVQGTGGQSSPFYFTRQDALSATDDISLDRNKEVYAYLQRLTGVPFPGASGGSFASKPYGGPRGRDQILTEIFDYIRTANLQDLTLVPAQRFSLDAVVTPTRHDAGNGDTSGFGRSYSVRQAGLLFICTADPADPRSNQAPGDPPSPGVKDNLSLAPGGKLQANERRIQALFFLETFSPSAGYKQFMRGYTFHPRIHVSGLDALTINTTLTANMSLGFPATGSIVPGVDLSSFNGAFGTTGGAMNWRWPFMKSLSATHDMRTTGSLTGDSAGYPFISLPVTLKYNPGNPQMTLQGGNVTIEFRDPTDTYVLNTVRVRLSAVTLPLPSLHPTKQQYWAFHKKGIFGDNAPSGRFFTTGNLTGGPVVDVVDPAGSAEALVTASDTVQAWIVAHGDNRLSFGPDAGGTEFQPVPARGPFPNLRHMLAEGGAYTVLGHSGGQLLSGNSVTTAVGQGIPVFFQGADYPSALNKPWTFFDWDTGSPMPVTDGPLLNKTDEGSINFISSGKNPYASEYTEGENPTQAPVYHSANRQMPSAAMFGSLPTGMITGQPWQTLLFRPDPGGHPGATDPPDHLLLDLFWMPVVEPYAISEPFSTAGKVNMNYQMIPFTYIERSTGMRAILMDEELYAVPDAGWSSGYGKKYAYASKPGLASFSLPLDPGETLEPFRNKFQAGQVFLTPSEIMENYLVPQGETFANMPTFWAAHSLTGENIKERAYATIFPRLTTQSNVFNIHYRAQALRKRPGSPPNVWEEGKDQSVAESRGSATLERFLDMNRSDLPDFATQPNAYAGAFYRFRILSNKEFNP